MKCSSASTSRGGAGALGAALLLSLLAGGCQPAPHAAPARSVRADLGVLVRRHPGWAGVARYDRMLALLDRSVRQAQAGVGRPVPPLTLPAQGGLLPSGEAYTIPPAALAQERLQLAAQQRSQIERLRRRRVKARLQQIALQEGGWRREAQTRYALAAQAAQDQYAQRFSEAFTADSARRLNLTLQVNALQKTVADWKLSTPPTPRLNEARAELAAKSALLARLETQQTGALLDLRRARDTTLAGAAADRDSYVARQRAQLVATLTAQDEAVLGVQRTLLRRQTESLLRQERVLASAAAPTVGSLGALALTPAPAGAVSAGRLEAAESSLRGQRARWVLFLYDDTRAAAREAARQQGWRVSFGPPRGDEPDLTPQLAALLAGRVWKS